MLNAERPVDRAPGCKLPRALLTISALALAAGCASRTGNITMRLVGGKPQPTRFVSSNAYEYYLRAEIALNRGALSEAAHHLNAALAFDPDAPYLHTRLGRVLLHMGRFQQAEQRVDAALKLQSNFPDALLLRAMLHLKARNEAAAVEVLQHSIATNPRHGAAYLRLAELFEQRGQMAKARKLLHHMVLRVPHPRDAYRSLALLCLRELDYRCAAEAYTRVLQLQPDVDSLMRLSHVQHALGNAEAAERLLREAFDRTGGHFGVAVNLVKVLAERKQVQGIDDLLDILDRASGDHPERRAQLIELAVRGKRTDKALALAAPHARDSKEPALLLAKAVVLHAQGRAAEAEALLRPMIDGPAGGQAALRLARLLGERGAHAEVEAVLRQAIAKHGEQDDLIMALSHALHLGGKREDAVSVVQQTLQRRKSRNLRYSLGEALERAGRWREAVALMKRALNEGPNDATAHNFIGYTLADHNVDLDQAERAIRRALYLRPGEGFIMDSLGWLYYRQGRFAEARRVLMMALRVSPSEPEIVVHLAEVEVALRQLSRALALFHRALRLSQDEQLNARVRDRIRQLTRLQVGRRTETRP